MTCLTLRRSFLLMMIALSSTNAFGQEPSPTPIPSPPGGKLVTGTAGNTSTTKNTEPIQIRFRIYTNNQVLAKRTKTDLKRLEERLVEAIGKWTRGFANNSDVKFKPPAESLGYDLEEVLFRRIGKRKKPDPVLRFASKLSKEPERAQHQWIKEGTDDFVKNFLHKNLSKERQKDDAKKIDRLPYTFHIIVVKDVNGSAGSIPGKWIEDTNVIFLDMKLAQGSNYENDLFHEVGHLFGLGDHNSKEHKESWGIMMKYPIDPNTKRGSYGDEEKYGWKREKTKEYRIKRMKAHFGL